MIVYLEWRAEEGASNFHVSGAADGGDEGGGGEGAGGEGWRSTTSTANPSRTA